MRNKFRNRIEGVSGKTVKEKKQKRYEAGNNKGEYGREIVWR